MKKYIFLPILSIACIHLCVVVVGFNTVMVRACVQKMWDFYIRRWEQKKAKLLLWPLQREKIASHWGWSLYRDSLHWWLWYHHRVVVFSFRCGGREQVRLLGLEWRGEKLANLLGVRSHPGILRNNGADHKPFFKSASDSDTHVQDLARVFLTFFSTSIGNFLHFYCALKVLLKHNARPKWVSKQVFKSVDVSELEFDITTDLVHKNIVPCIWRGKLTGGTLTVVTLPFAAHECM